MPNLIEVQKKSYEWFLDQGLREVLTIPRPSRDYTGNLELSFLDFRWTRSRSTALRSARRGCNVCNSAEGPHASAQQGDRRDQGAGNLHG